MAIKVQVKGDKTFEDAFATTTDCCNGSFVNDAFGQYGQTWTTPMDAFNLNLNPAYTTTTPEGLYAQPIFGSQIPASLVNLYGANTALAGSYQGFKPFAAPVNSPVAYANTNTVPFGSSTQSVLPMGGVINTMNAYGQVAPTTTGNAFGASFAPSMYTNGSPFMGSTLPVAPEFFGASFAGKGSAMMNTTSPFIAASEIASQLINGYGITPVVASQIASIAMTSPVAAASYAAQYGVNPTFVSQLIAKSTWANAASVNPMFSQPASSYALNSLETTPWLKGVDSWSATTAPMTAWAANGIQQPIQAASAMPVDIYETEDDYILFSDMPGASIEDIDILVEGQMLIIKGFIKPASWDKLGMGTSAVSVLQEKPAVKNFQRVFPINSNVLTDKLTAKLTDGILTVKLPKVKVGFGSTRRVAVATA